jgi:hypothetical protein
MPVAPSPGDIKAPRPWQFYQWDHPLKTVTSDDVYTAEYIQSSDICWTSFYVGNQWIANDFPRKGAVPVAPDMSKYNTADQQFVGWWPSLHASTENSACYTAIFKSYVNVTFKDRDGKVISQQRVLSGNTPEAPKVDDVVQGEEDYYEYHFRQWADEKGVKLGPVYWDTVYSPIYDKSYLEVTTTFDADGHTFADGTTIKEYKGTYKAYNFLYLPQVTYWDDYTYTVEYWQSTEKVNGAYVKLYMSKWYTDYKYNLTFKPVFKKGTRIEYTVRFYGGDEPVYLKGYYGDVITSDLLTDLKKTSVDENYVYELYDYGLTLPYQFGTVLGADGLPAQDIGVVAKFTPVGVSKTFTFDANGGIFADNKTVKTVTGPYGTSASFCETPVRADDDWYTYKFAGWSFDIHATAGSSFCNFIINGNRTLYAVYTKTPKNTFTITFDAGEGHFEEGNKTILQAYGLGEIIVPPADPVRDETQEYRYLFIGWLPKLSAGTAVTGDCTYTASYRAVRKDGVLEETGIIVTDGVSYEDICVNSIPGYTYALSGPSYIPTLTITGNGLTFSGSSDEVCIVIQSDVTDVMFEDLTLSGAYSDVNGVLERQTRQTALPSILPVPASSETH